MRYSHWLSCGRDLSGGRGEMMVAAVLTVHATLGGAGHAGRQEAVGGLLAGTQKAGRWPAALGAWGQMRQPGDDGVCPLWPW